MIKGKRHSDASKRKMRAAKFERSAKNIDKVMTKLIDHRRGTHRPVYDPSKKL